jgi:hypothetical protein
MTAIAPAIEVISEITFRGSFIMKRNFPERWEESKHSQFSAASGFEPDPTLPFFSYSKTYRNCQRACALPSAI